MKVQDLDLNYQLVEDILASFLRNEIRKFGFQSLVLGLSGGIDSAVVCELAVRALGADNVLALKMPYRASSRESLEHADLMVQRLAIRSEEHDISPAVDAFLPEFPRRVAFEGATLWRASEWLFSMMCRLVMAAL